MTIGIEDFRPYSGGIDSKDAKTPDLRLPAWKQGWQQAMEDAQRDTWLKHPVLPGPTLNPINNLQSAVVFKAETSNDNLMNCSEKKLFTSLHAGAKKNIYSADVANKEIKKMVGHKGCNVLDQEDEYVNTAQSIEIDGETAKNDSQSMKGESYFQMNYEIQIDAGSAIQAVGINQSAGEFDGSVVIKLRELAKAIAVEAGLSVSASAAQDAKTNANVYYALQSMNPESFSGLVQGLVPENKNFSTKGIGLNGSKMAFAPLVADRQPLRMHAEWQGDQLRLWFGVDENNNFDTQEIARQLLDFVSKQGISLVSVVCNGKLLSLVGEKNKFSANIDNGREDEGWELYKKSEVNTSDLQAVVDKLI